MGLCVLPYMNDILNARKKVCDTYDALLNTSKLQKLKIRPDTEWNYSYYPIIFESEKVLLTAEKLLNANNIFPRRYFYPSLSKVPFVTNYK